MAALAGKESTLLNDEIGIDNTTTSVLVSRDGDLASLCGRIDIDSSPAVRDRLLALLRARHAEAITIDLSSVVHIDSSGVATLIEALKVARTQNTELRLQGLDDRLLRLFKLTGILPLFNGEHSGVSEPEYKAV
ncbi:MAG: STAS domain-containing protein [Acidobacteria bacterium]|nr:STAS domain-containing protein [Acidobacteriota bacterium]